MPARSILLVPRLGVVDRDDVEDNDSDCDIALERVVERGWSGGEGGGGGGGTRGGDGVAGGITTCCEAS